MRKRDARCPGGVRTTLCFILPADVLIRIVEEGSRELRDAAVRNLVISERIRERRALVRRLVHQDPVAANALMGPAIGKRRSVYDANHGTAGDLPGTMLRSEGDPEVADPSANQAYDGSGTTYDFYQDVFSRTSVDDSGLELVSSVHFETGYDNALWNGSQMVYGDGDGQMFLPDKLTSCLDVIAHELTHGVTQYTCELRYRGQSGALNESFSDVFGSLVKQKTLSQPADQADWLIGEGILGPALDGEALRSLKAPGTAYRYDTQPGTMDHYVTLPIDSNPRNDNGGVHINSGIPNHAFYLVATSLGGNAWEKPGAIWYDALTRGLNQDSDFQQTADATVAAAAARYGAGGTEEKAVREAWAAVGLRAA